MSPEEGVVISEEIQPMFSMLAFLAFLSKKFENLNGIENWLYFYVWLVQSNVRKMGCDEDDYLTDLLQSDWIIPRNKCDLYLKTMLFFQKLHPVRTVEIEGQKRTASTRFGCLGLRPNASGFMLLNEKSNYLHASEYNGELFQQNIRFIISNNMVKSEKEDYGSQVEDYLSLSVERNESAHKAEFQKSKTFFQRYISLHNDKEQKSWGTGEKPPVFLPKEFFTANNYYAKYVTSCLSEVEERRDVEFKMAMSLSNTTKYESDDTSNDSKNRTASRTHFQQEFPLSCQLYMIYSIGTGMLHMLGEIFDFFKDNSFLQRVLSTETMRDIAWDAIDGRMTMQQRCITYLKQAGGPFGLNTRKTNAKNVEFFSILWIMLMLALGTEEEHHKNPAHQNEDNYRFEANKGLNLFHDLLKMTLVPTNILELFKTIDENLSSITHILIINGRKDIKNSVS